MIGDSHRLLVEAVHAIAVAMLDPDGRVATWNSGGQRITGWTDTEIIGTDLRVLCGYYSAERRRLTRLLEAAADAPVTDQTWLVRKDGTRFFAELALAPIAGKRGFALTLADGTERKRAEDERLAELSRERAARAEAEARNHAHDEFLATLSHELRTPLMSIVGWTRELHGRRTDEATLARALWVIERAAAAQLRMIEELLDVTRIAAGKLVMEERAVDLTAVASLALESARPIAHARHVTLELSQSVAPLVALGDAERLQQVVGNLLANAIKFTPANGRVRVELRRLGEVAEVRVVDDGEGIEAELLPRVFERFRQGAGRPQGGLGLGLAIVQHIVHAHGGTVEAESAGPGHGATFVVRLPLHAAAVLDEPPRGDEQTDGDCDLSGVRVLLVEDEPDARELLLEVLRHRGATVMATADAASAVAAVASFGPDVLVSDIGLDGEDGYALIRRVRALPPSHGGAIPAVALTGYVRAQDRARVLAAGYQLHLPKPTDAAHLARAIAGLCARRSSAAESSPAV